MTALGGNGKPLEGVRVLALEQMQSLPYATQLLARLPTPVRLSLVQNASALASTGFITVLPDLLGFGDSDEIFHPYYVEDPTATAVTDLLRAAATLADEKEVEFNQRLFLAGYSQGGYATLATHKALEADPLEDFDLIASFPGSGGYDIQSLQEYFFSLNTYNDPYYLAYVGLAYQSYYGEANLIDEFFNEPYASRIPGLFDGVNAAGDINAQLTEEIPALVQTEALTGAVLEQRLLEVADCPADIPIYVAEHVLGLPRSY